MTRKNGNKATAVAETVEAGFINPIAAQLAAAGFIIPDQGGVMQAVIAEQPQGDAPLENRGVDKNEHPDSYFTRPEAVERDDDLPRTPRRIGVGVNISGP